MTPRPTQPQLTPIANIEQRLREAVDRARIEAMHSLARNQYAREAGVTL